MATEPLINKGKNKGHANLIPIKKGETLNPNGRPKGQRNYATLYREALIKLAESVDMTGEELEDQIHQKALAMARKGDYRFYKDINDRLHGMAKQDVNIEVSQAPTPIYNGKSIKKKLGK